LIAETVILHLGYLSLLVMCAPIELYFLLLNSNSNMCIDLPHLPIAFIVFLEYKRTLFHMIDDVGHGLVMIVSLNSVDFSPYCNNILQLARKVAP
jgi:hypothetical protein